MRITPIMNTYNKGKSSLNNSTKFESKNNFSNAPKRVYTGIASIDLAYASIIDDNIAKDLKLMGLI